MLFSDPAAKAPGRFAKTRRRQHLGQETGFERLRGGAQTCGVIN